MRFSLVCEFSWAHCASKYVASTIRALCSRVAEHAGRNSRTGNTLVHTSHSSIRLHVESKWYCCDWKYIKVLRSSSNNLDLRILESLYIFKTRQRLNGNTSASPLHIVNAWCAYMCSCDGNTSASPLHIVNAWCAYMCSCDGNTSASPLHIVNAWCAYTCSCALF